MYDSDLLNYFNSPKLALNYVLALKRNNPAIRKVTVPADFKYVDVLARVFGQDNVFLAVNDYYRLFQCVQRAKKFG